VSSTPAGRLPAAEQFVQRREEFLDPWISDAIPEGLAFPPEGDDPLLPQFGQMLRQSRLRETDRVRQRGHVRLAPLDKLAQDHQAPLVPEGAHDARDLCGLALDHVEIDLHL
jgi:hypothetical protein